ncbi:MAG: hypothetical protein FWC15_08425 [Fibromonadales bacterium]|nr:hypothetical protein [Fibromonadales bacterium]MCL2261359.1 hypothetical protein [Fibromonadales bacterium]
MKNIFPILPIAIMFFFCGFILLRFSVKQILIDNGVENKFTEIVMFDAKNAFSRSEDETIFVKAVKEKLEIKKEQKFFNARNYRGSNFKKKIEDYTTDWLPFRKLIVQTAFFADFSFGNKILPNNVVDLGNGYLTESKKIMNIDVDAFVQKIGYFKRILDSLGIPLVYVQYPHVICSEDNISKTGKDQNIRTKNELMKKLRDINIPIVDLHKEFHQRANNDSKEFHHSLFYKTDHHWQAKTAIWAGQIISERLNELYDFDLETELLDAANFTEIFAKKWLGSIGEKVIPLYSKEDFYTYSPKYVTDINWLLFKKELFESKGSFDNLHHFLYQANEGKVTYSIAYTDFSFSRNNNLPNGKKILLIGDSFNNSLSKFFALVFKEVNFIYRKSSLLDDYLANKPDIVIIAFNNGFTEPMNNLLF